jgi:DNA polymerase-3 subunit alpha
MAMITLDDATSTMDGVIFSDAFAAHGHLLEPEAIVFLKGKVDRRREEPNIIIEQVIPVAEAPEVLTRAVRIVFRDRDAAGQPRTYNGEMMTLRTMLRQMAGAAQVQFEVHIGGQVALLESPRVRVRVDAELPHRIAAILKDDRACQLIGPPRLFSGAAARPDVVIADDSEAVVNRLRRNTADDHGYCDSIDRY